MAEPQDAVLPILKKIQDDVSTGFRRVDAKLNDMAEILLDQGEKLDDIESKMTYHLGITAAHVHDIKSIREELKSLRLRVDALEQIPTA